MTRGGFLLALPALLGACALGPDYTPPVPPEGATAPLVAASPAATTQQEAPDSWWRLYDDPVMDGLIGEAFAANEDLKAAEANLAASRAIYEGARASLLPRTGIAAGAVDGRDPVTDEILEIDGHKPETLWLYDALIDVSYEVDLFGHVARSIEAAKGNREAVAAARDMMRVTVAAETARSYGQICTLGEQIAVAERSLALVTSQQEIARRRRGAGAGSDAELLRAEELVAQIGAALPGLKGQRRAALFQLATLLGRPPSKAPASVDSCVQPPHLGTPLPVGDGAALLRRRPDIRRSDRMLAVALAEIGVATADLYPRITLGGFYGGVTDKFDHLATEDALAWGIGPSISWSFPNMAGPLARLHATKAGADAALSNFNEVVLRALKETEQALAVYTAEIDHHGALTEAQEKARRSFAVAERAFSAGAISHADLLTAEQRLIAADEAVALSDSALMQGQIAVFKALGGGWQSTRPQT